LGGRSLGRGFVRGKKQEMVVVDVVGEGERDAERQMKARKCEQRNLEE